MIDARPQSIVPQKVLNILKILLGRYAKKSYSQEGEDLILKRIFERKQNGFYVDVGAHHPMRFSNTYLFYKRGWRGINIDAMPGSMEIFKKFRFRDINLEIAVSNRNEKLTYYAFNDPALNGFSKERSQERNGQYGYKIIYEKEIYTQQLEKILDDYLPNGQIIDYMSIDVEGLEFEVLQSNNWKKYSPELVLVEIRGETLDDILGSEITEYMTDIGYKIFGKTLFTIFFKKNKGSENEK
jgi:FkbM family methyltransferase